MSHHVTLIRHAESHFNAHGVMVRDISITDTGKQQANSLNMEFDVIVCSTVKRARETLDHSNIKYKELVFSDLCREVLDGNIVNYYNHEEVKIETGEDVDERIKKFKKLLDDLRKENKKVGVISHYCFLKQMTGYHFNNCHWWSFFDPLK